MNIHLWTCLIILIYIDPPYDQEWFYRQSADNSSFRINGDQLVILERPDYEVKDTYRIRIQTKDNGGLVNDAYFQIRVENLEEYPYDITLSSESFDENLSKGAVIAFLDTSDDIVTDTHTYSFASGSGDTDNGSFSIKGNRLKIRHSPDFEAKSSYSIRLKTTDSNGFEFEKAFELTVNDINEIADNVINSLLGKGKLWGTRKADQFTFDQFEPFGDSHHHNNNPRKIFNILTRI